MKINFRILGPVEVLADGQALDLGSPQQRATLAALLLTPNRRVASDALIDALWGSEPPGSAAKALQIYVSRLRRILGKERLETKPPGYLLHVAADEFDLFRFEQLRAEGQFEEALALWQGPPFADLAYRPFMLAEIARLEELRLGCLEERIERDLDHGYGAELVGELESVVAEHPFRESFCRQLMLALYRSGRQAEALEVYQGARRALVDELGIEPGRKLRELHHQILLQDAALETGVPSDPSRAQLDAPAQDDAASRTEVPAVLAQGVLTFLVVEVNAPATRLWDGEHEAVLATFALLDEMIGGVVEPHGGRFLQAISESGPRVSVFESAAAAVRAAIDATRALAHLSWPDDAPLQARIGLHTGEAQVRAGRYQGTTMTLAAGVSGEANAGEILLSGTTAALASDALPADFAVVALGRYHLAGFARPEEIVALAGPGLATPPGAADCPYRGLLSFGPEDRHLFFGREQVVSDVLARVAPGRLLVVVGASGSGKTSLLRAGVLGASRAGELTDVRTTRFITPGVKPTLDLGDGRDELLIVDQFEELYTQCRDLELRTQFVEAILSRPGPVLIGVRADFYGELGTVAALATAVASSQVLLGPMVDDDLRRAIVEPARMAGLRLEPGLVDLVLRDVAGEPGALPLMSHALRETWERREGRTLTVEGYEASGGVTSALARTADAVADAISYSDRPLLRNVFLRLTEVGDDLEDTRRRVPIEELIPDGSSEHAVRNLLERLADARLVILGEGRAELAHEVLIRRWPTLRRWIDEDREGIRLHRRIADAARLWEASGRDAADLYRGTRLDAAVEWAAHNRALLNGSERDFLTASVDESARTQRNHDKDNRRLRRALVAGVLLLAATAGLLTWALIQRSNAIQSSRVATSVALASDATSLGGTNLASSLLLAIAGYHADPTPQAATAVTLALQSAESSGVDAILRSCGEVNDVAFGSGGRTLAVGCYSGNTMLWSLGANGSRRWSVLLPAATSCNRVRGVAFDSGGATLAVGCDNGYTVLWRIAAGKPRGAPFVLPPVRSCDSVNGVAFSGGTLAVGCKNGKAVLWDIAAGKPQDGPTTLSAGSNCDIVNAVAFDDAGATLAVGCNNGNTFVWGITAGKPDGAPVTLPSGRDCDAVNAVAFGGGTLAVGCNDGNTVLWNIPPVRLRIGPIVLFGGSSCNAVGGVAFGGGTLAVGCADGNTALWVIAAGKPRGEPLTVPGSTSCDVVDGVAFGGGTVAVGCADGNTLLLADVAPRTSRAGPATFLGANDCDAVNAAASVGGELAVACDNGNTKLWDIAAGEPQNRPLTLPGGRSCAEALSVAFDPARRILAVGCTANTVVRDLAGGMPRGRTITLPGGRSCPKALSVAFGPDGETLAVGCNNGNTALWNLAPNGLHRRPRILRGAGTCDVVYEVAFDSSGGTLAIGCFNGNTVLWNVTEGEPRGTPVVLPPGSSCDAVYGVAFGSGGKTLAVGCYNGNVVLWPTAGGKPHGAPITLPPGSKCDPLLGVAFSSDGETLAASCYSGNAVLWEIKAGRPRGGPITLPAHGTCHKVYGVAFASRGTLALGCSNGNTMLWNVVPWATNYANVRGRVCRFVWGDLTPDEWNTLAPGLAYVVPCPRA